MGKYWARLAHEIERTCAMNSCSGRRSNPSMVYWQMHSQATCPNKSRHALRISFVSESSTKSLATTHSGSLEKLGRSFGLVTVLRRSPISLCHLGFERERADVAHRSEEPEFAWAMRADINPVLPTEILPCNQSLKISRHHSRRTFAIFLTPISRHFTKECDTRCCCS